MKKRSGIAAWTIVFVLVAVFMLSKTDQKSTIINFNQFQSDWTSNTVKSFVVEVDQMTVSGTLKNGTTYKTIVPSARLFQFIKDHPKSESVQETYVKPPTIPVWLQYLPNVLLILIDRKSVV